MRAHNFIDMAGWKMWEHGVPESRLIVSEYAGTINGKSMWRCICSCEDKNEIVAAGSNIRNGNTLSCGCVHREKTKKINICERTVNGRWQGKHANWITHWMRLPEPPKEELR